MNTQRMNITKEDILKHFKEIGKPVAYPSESLVMTFGFKRVSGEEIMLTKLLRPSEDEVSLGTLPKYEMDKNITSFCEEYNLNVEYRRGDYIFSRGISHFENVVWKESGKYSYLYGKRPAFVFISMGMQRLLRSHALHIGPNVPEAVCGIPFKICPDFELEEFVFPAP